MELKINPVMIPEKIEFNYDELKAELVERVHLYETTVYSDDQIKAAKADRSQLNKLKKALNDERIRRQREYMKPFEDFAAKINEIIAIIDKPVAMIDMQVKDYEERKKKEKAAEIEQYFMSVNPYDWLHIGMIFNKKWLNASVAMKTVQADIDAEISRIQNEYGTLSHMPEFGFEAAEVYKDTLDMSRALNEAKRLSELQKRKEEAEKLRKEQELATAMNAPELPQELPAELPVENEVPETQTAGQWVSFTAFLTVQQALQLKDFFNRNKIEFRPI
jgi:hypothetical protein